MAQFTYQFVGDTPKRLKGRVIRPGDVVESEEELHNGELEPQNDAAKAAKAATEAKDVEFAAQHKAEREAAAAGPQDETEAPVSTGKRARKSPAQEA